MFTGLIENIGMVKKVASRGNYLELTIVPDPMFKNLEKGESIAVSGPCLTIVAFDEKSFTVEASQETIRLTTLKNLRRGDRVNLERALRADARVGGHFVNGHIDCFLRIRKIQKVGQSRQIEVDLPREYAGHIIDKGSVALDGVSLTVMDVGRKSFAVNLIPETQSRTTLANLRVGDYLNVEFDLIGKYILRFLELKKKGTQLTLASMREMGY
jgi:riboflavin synthase